MAKKIAQLTAAEMRYITEVRGQKVILDSTLAEIFGTETKRLNETVKRNPKKFNSRHIFQLTASENKLLKSQSATSKDGRGGRRSLPWAFTDRGVIRVAMLLDTNQALEASDLVADVFLEVQRQLASGKTEITLKEPSKNLRLPDEESRRGQFKEKLFSAMDALLNTVIDVQSGSTVRNEVGSLSAGALNNLKERLRTKGLQNEHLQADTELLIAKATETYAAARKTNSEAIAIDVQTLETRIRVLKELLTLSQQMENSDFVGILDRLDPGDAPLLIEGQNKDDQ